MPKILKGRGWFIRNNFSRGSGKTCNNQTCTVYLHIIIML